MKVFKNLDKSWKEILYAMSGFGPNLLMILMGAFYSDAINPAALTGNAIIEQSIAGVCIVVPWLYAILGMIAKSFDGIIDIPLAALTDNLKSKIGKRRLPIMICFIPMVLSYACLWIPIFGQAESARLGNTIWFVIMSFIFFGTYTMNLIAFYGSLSQVTYNDAQRARVSSYKAFFDTITYVVVYALVPLMISTSFPVGKLVFVLLPVMCTILIPVFMIKEGDKWEAKLIAEGYDIKLSEEEVHVGIFQSIKQTMLNKPFLKWNIVNACTFFGLQMFLVSMNALIVGLMGLESIHMTILNTCAFAPVPIMLYLFQKLKAKKGLRFTYQSCLLCFAICIMSFLIGSEYIMGPGNYGVKVLVGAIGGITGSWALGAFFMMPLLIPAQVSSVEEKLTGKNQSAMYFAGQALFTSIIGAAAAALYDCIKNFFVTKDFSQITYATSRADAAEVLNLAQEQVFCLGTLLVPIIVSACCIAGFFLAFRMCKNYTPQEVAKELGLEKEYEEKKELFPQETIIDSKNESIGVNIGLWVLSGSIFGFIWNYGMRNRVNEFGGKRIGIVHYILSVIVFPYSAVLYYKYAKNIKAECDKLGIKCKDYSIIFAICGAVFLWIIPLAVLQTKLNKIFNSQY